MTQIKTGHMSVVMTIEVRSSSLVTILNFVNRALEDHPNAELEAALRDLADNPFITYHEEDTTND